MQGEFKDYNIKFIVLLVDEKTLLLRDKERSEDCQMNERCITLLNSFKNNNYDKQYILDTSNITVSETVDIFENDKFECFLVGNPRAEGHVAISTKKHFKDMMEIDDKTCKEIFLLAKKTMNILKEIYNAESVYLCTMCDGPMNHFHIQLIPRYSFEKRGSKNFVKPRFEYKEGKEKLMKLRGKMQS